MEREIKTLKTPEGKELILKSFITAKERNDFLVSIEDDGISSERLGTFAVAIKLFNKLLKLVGAVYDGQTDCDLIVGQLENGPSGEYDFVLEQANIIITGNFTQAK